jgi:cell division protease FtsH
MATPVLMVHCMRQSPDGTPHSNSPDEAHTHDGWFGCPDNIELRSEEEKKPTMNKKSTPARFGNDRKKPSRADSRPDQRDLLNKRRPAGPQPPPGKQPGGKPGWPFGHRIAFIILLVMLGWFLWNQMSSETENYKRVSYTTFISFVDDGQISSAEIAGETFYGKLTEPRQITVPTDTEPDNRVYDGIEVQIGAYDKSFEVVYEGLVDKSIDVRLKRENTWVQILISTLPWILIFGIWLFFIRQMQGGPKSVFSFGKSRAKMMAENQAKVTFDDVAGVEEAKTELQEIIDFLKDPRKFQRLGGKIPKGALLVGPPGTGKTLLARAVAGEAGVPFFSMSGSGFVEMFVGVGASRVRDLFEQGKTSAPCILFIDEIDAVGRQRGAGIGGGHDEREQTLNQLLVEMDGFESNDGVILLAATNRPDVLDPALLRPGRFDRQIVVDWPDVKAREMILTVHAKKIQIAKSVDLEIIAKQTPGMTGADLANVVNEAALLGARLNRDRVTMADFEEAKDKVMLGGERRTLVIDNDEKKLTAYHESGHVLAAKFSPHADPIHKVSIIARGRALGLTYSLPTSEKHNWSFNYCQGKLAFLLGGRAAEIIKFGDVTNGASNDIENATRLARKMVCEWGMSKRIGPLTFGKKDSEVFLGREISTHKDYSEETAVAIDQEVRKFVESGLQQAETIIRDHIDMLEALTEELLKKEVLGGTEIDAILNGGTADSAKSSTGPSRRSRRRRRPSVRKTNEQNAADTAEKKETDDSSEKQPDKKQVESETKTDDSASRGGRASRALRRRPGRKPKQDTPDSDDSGKTPQSTDSSKDAGEKAPEPKEKKEPRKAKDAKVAKDSDSKDSGKTGSRGRGKLVRLKIGGRQRVIRKMPAKKIRKIN